MSGRGSHLVRNLLWAITALTLLQWQSTSACSEEKLVFEKDVAPLLKTHCLKCHGPDKRESGFDVRRRFTLLNGGDTGAGIVPGNPSKSLMIERIEAGEMPPEEEPQLTKEELATLRTWIRTGAAIAFSPSSSLSDRDG